MSLLFTFSLLLIAFFAANAARAEAHGDFFVEAVSRAKGAFDDIPSGAAVSVARAVLSRDEVEIVVMDGSFTVAARTLLLKVLPPAEQQRLKAGEITEAEAAALREDARASAAFTGFSQHKESKENSK